MCMITGRKARGGAWQFAGGACVGVLCVRGEKNF
jgi:hypothetical protein